MNMRYKKTKPMESSLLSISSNDLLFEILSRCSLKVIDKSKVISKFFNEIAYEHAFMQCHKNKLGTIYGYIFQSSHGNNHSYKLVSPDAVDIRSTLTFDFLPPDSKIFASSDQGLLCYATLTGDDVPQHPRHEYFASALLKFYVCKPATRQTERLPYPDYCDRLCKNMDLVVLQSNPLRYKIVGMCRDNDNRYALEIFDSKIWSWKLLNIKLPNPPSKQQDNSVSASGRLHWLLSDDQGLALDLVTETYTFFTLPVLDKEKYFGTINMQLVKYKGKLGLICQDLESFEIWVIEDYKNRVWKKINKIYTENLKKKHMSCVVHAVNLYASNIVLMKGRGYMFYDIENHCSVNVAGLDLPLRVTHPHEVFPFRSDLEPVDLRRREC
ncbi:hypothetical protein POM88_040816 [Heracleum sosnowskyi]|uniref:F-box associated beta-propeller type 3 domain-containing protein n=1 Tax=Heracleum sosnowskyi TaxID=360622 RepID=A0AAD8HCZ5_9APIA|nr:hypothetical protein POM88_040816 [Heracleum sosnowskyi]